MKRPVIAALAGAVLLLACLAGCVDPGAGPRGTEAPPGGDGQEAPTVAPTFGPGLVLEVEYTGMWSGAYGTLDAVRSEDGFGNTSLPLPLDASFIQAKFMKQEANDEPLTLRVVRDGVVLARASSSEPMAVVTLEASAD
ncbi:MAG: hypothetical protein GXY82_10075 [Methanospirillum sp.]|nr:hypothetical protein [Methanospirillum sp.]